MFNCPYYTFKTEFLYICRICVCRSTLSYAICWSKGTNKVHGLFHTPLPKVVSIQSCKFQAFKTYNTLIRNPVVRCSWVSWYKSRRGILSVKTDLAVLSKSENVQRHLPHRFHLDCIYAPLNSTGRKTESLRISWLILVKYTSLRICTITFVNFISS